MSAIRLIRRASGDGVEDYPALEQWDPRASQLCSVFPVIHFKMHPWLG